MDEAVLVDADVDEDAEVDDVADGAGQHHAGLQILELQHVRAQDRRGQIAARVAAGLDQLLDDILQRRHADPAFGRGLLCAVGAELVGKGGHLGLARVFQVDPQQLRELLRRVIALRVHARVVEHLPALRHAQKACALFKRLRPQLRDLLDLRARGERAVFLTVGDDVFGCRRVQARDLPQQRSGSRIEVHADRVDARLDPGYSHGCKVAVVDETGKVLDTTVVYPTFGEKQKQDAIAKLSQLIKKDNVRHLAIGNGTASRETEAMAVEMIRRLGGGVSYMIVNEAGASVYSASKLAAEEFPQYDVNLRSAVSIARRR